MDTEQNPEVWFCGFLAIANCNITQSTLTWHIFTHFSIRGHDRYHQLLSKVFSSI